MNPRRLVLLLLVAMAIGVYAIPAYRSDRVFWFSPDYHPEYYRGAAFPFTGYVYPLLLLLLFISAATPYLIGSARLPGLSGTIGGTWSRFTLLLLGVLAILFIIWLVVTPVF
jgi:hypothetical protein